METSFRILTLANKFMVTDFGKSNIGNRVTKFMETNFGKSNTGNQI